MNLKPLSDYLVVEVVEQPDHSMMGIFLPETAKGKPQEGKVVAAGPGALPCGPGSPTQRSSRIEPRITHQELAAMVGTTRSRIGTFMHRFLELGLIEFSCEHFLIVKEHKLMAYLAQVG